MTKIEAMKQALEALEMLARYENPETRVQVRKPKDGGPIVTMYPHKVATDAADAIRTAIAEAEKQEPVAWMIIGDGKFGKYEPGLHFDFVSNEKYWKNRGYKMVPVYTTPPAAQQEPDAYGYAKRLAEAIWQKHYKATAPQWKPLDDLIGVLTQIDNMTAGLTFYRQPLTEEQIDDIWNRYCDEMGEASINDAYDIARAIEAAHGIGEKT